MHNNISLHQFVNDPQYAKDGDMKPYDVFVQGIIREHAKHSADGYILFAEDLPLHDQKIFLSYLLDAHEYEAALSNPHLTLSYIEDELSNMQTKIDESIDDVYHADMREMGMCLNRHADNGEFTYYRR